MDSLPAVRALLVVNPAATALTPRLRDVLAHALSSEVRLEVRETKSRTHATELAAQASAEGCDVVVALGGDGTVNEVVNGLLADGPGPHVPALGVVPAGSTNVFARALGLPNAPVEAAGALLDALRAERRRTVGLGQVEDRWFTFNAGFGLDAAVVRRVDGHRRRGRRATPGLFVRSGARQFLLHTSASPSIVLEQPAATTRRLGIALVCNTSPWTYLGDRPVVPCPRASFASGLDLFGLTTLRTVPLLRSLRQVLSEQPHLTGRSVVQVHDAAEIVLSTSAPLPLQIDGEDLGDRFRVVLRSRPDALQIVV